MDVTGDVTISSVDPATPTRTRTFLIILYVLFRTLKSSVLELLHICSMQLISRIKDAEYISAEKLTDRVEQLEFHRQYKRHMHNAYAFSFWP